MLRLASAASSYTQPLSQPRPHKGMPTELSVQGLGAKADEGSSDTRNEAWQQCQGRLQLAHLILKPAKVLCMDSGMSLIALYGNCDCYYMSIRLSGLQVAILGTL